MSLGPRPLGPSCGGAAPRIIARTGQTPRFLVQSPQADPPLRQLASPSAIHLSSELVSCGVEGIAKGDLKAGVRESRRKCMSRHHATPRKRERDPNVHSVSDLMPVVGIACRDGAANDATVRTLQSKDALIHRSAKRQRERKISKHDLRIQKVHR